MAAIKMQPLVLHFEDYLKIQNEEVDRLLNQFAINYRPGTSLPSTFIRNASPVLGEDLSAALEDVITILPEQYSDYDISAVWARPAWTKDGSSNGYSSLVLLGCERQDGQVDYYLCFVDA